MCNSNRSEGTPQASLPGSETRLSSCVDGSRLQNGQVINNKKKRKFLNNEICYKYNLTFIIKSKKKKNKLLNTFVNRYNDLFFTQFTTTIHKISHPKQKQVLSATSILFENIITTKRPALKGQLKPPTGTLHLLPERVQVCAHVVYVREQDEEAVPAHVVVHHSDVQGRLQDVLVAYLQQAYGRFDVVLAGRVRLDLVRDGPGDCYRNNGGEKLLGLNKFLLYNFNS